MLKPKWFLDITRITLAKASNLRKGFIFYRDTVKIIKKSPTRSHCFFALGRLAVTLEKNLDKGEKNLKKYLQTDPSDERLSFAFAPMLLGHIYRMQEKKELARNEYEQALELDPEFEMARKAVKDF